MEVRVIHIGEHPISRFEMSQLKYFLRSRYRGVEDIDIETIIVGPGDKEEEWSGYCKLQETVKIDFKIQLTVILLPADKVSWIVRLTHDWPNIKDRTIDILMPSWSMCCDGGGESYLSFHGFVHFRPEYFYLLDKSKLVDSTTKINERGGKLWYEDPSNF